MRATVESLQYPRPSCAEQSLVSSNVPSPTLKYSSKSVNMRVGSYFLFVLIAAGSALAHMEMSTPPPFRSRHNPNMQSIDYDMKRPLKSDGESPFTPLYVTVYDLP